MNTKFLILAGGYGSRLWPLSRKLYAKQFLKLFNDKSLLQNSILRIYPQISSENIFIITNSQSKFIVYDQIREIIPNYKESNIIVEPASLNTCYSIIYSLSFFNENDNIYIMPSDQYFEDDSFFLNKLSEAKTNFDDSKILLHGIKITNFDLHYGYIQKGTEICHNKYCISKFVEKPDSSLQNEILSKNYYINSGILLFKKSTFLDLLAKYFKQGVDFYNKIINKENIDYQQIDPISIDKAFLESAKELEFSILNINFKDIISFKDFDDILPHSEENNVFQPNSDNILQINSNNSTIFSDSRLIVTLGTNNLIIADTPDALLVADKNNISQIEQVVAQLRNTNPKITNEHTTVYRPWGSYTILDCKENYQVKQLTINPGKKISLQYHKHRSETWTVVNGVAEVVKDKEYLTLFPSQSVFIPANTNHRLFNPLTTEPLTVIEVQTGDYLGEDDIIRIEDDFKRC